MNQEFNLSELIAVVADNTGLLKSDVKSVIENSFEVIAQQLATNTDNRIELHSLGVLALKKKKERSGIAPNGVEYTTPEHYRIKFRASDALIRAANEYGKEVLTLPIAR